MARGTNAVGATGIAFIGLVAVLSQQIAFRLPAPSTAPAEDIPADFLRSNAPLEGVLASNSRLLEAKRLFQGEIQGAESAALAPDGAIALGDRAGAIRRAVQQPGGGWKLDTQPIAVLEGGRPLGLHYDSQGNLVVCLAGKGLVQIAAGSHAVSMLASRTSKNGTFPATAIPYANDLDIAADGTVYFTDSSQIRPQKNAAGFYDTFAACVMTAFQGQRVGRLLAYDPGSKRTTTVLSDLWYANGVALSKDGDFVVVIDTLALRTWRVWLQGPKKGQAEVWLDQFPGYPDNINRAADGESFWIGVVTPPLPLQKALPHRFARWLLAWVPPRVFGKPPQWGCVLQVSAEGKILQMLMDPEGNHVKTVSNILDLGDRLILGGLAVDYNSEYKL